MSLPLADFLPAGAMRQAAGGGWHIRSRSALQALALQALQAEIVPWTGSAAAPRHPAAPAPRSRSRGSRAAAPAPARPSAAVPGRHPPRDRTAQSAPPAARPRRPAAGRRRTGAPWPRRLARRVGFPPCCRGDQPQPLQQVPHCACEAKMSRSTQPWRRYAANAAAAHIQ